MNLKEKQEAERAEFLKFQEKHPQLLQKIEFWGVGKGWRPLITDLCAVIEDHLQTVPLEIRGGIYVTCIKEKFGTLRFYMNQSTGEIDGAIMLAEKMSERICEMCGAPGALRSGFWVRTLCNRHELERKK